MTATMMNVTVTEQNEEYLAFAQTVDFTELFDRIKAFANVDCSFQQPEIDTDRSLVYINFKSDNIVEQTGAFASILESCHITSFGNGVFKDKETDALGYWVTANIRYRHKNGGSNGMELASAWYSGGKWKIVNVGERG